MKKSIFVLFYFWFTPLASMNCSSLTDLFLKCLKKSGDSNPSHHRTFQKIPCTINPVPSPKDTYEKYTKIEDLLDQLERSGNGYVKFSLLQEFCHQYPKPLQEDTLLMQFLEKKLKLVKETRTRATVSQAPPITAEKPFNVTFAAPEATTVYLPDESSPTVPNPTKRTSRRAPIGRTRTL